MDMIILKLKIDVLNIVGTLEYVRMRNVFRSMRIGNPQKVSAGILTPAKILP